jgi:hypothetical protein
MKFINKKRLRKASLPTFGFCLLPLSNITRSKWWWPNASPKGSGGRRLMAHVGNGGRCLTGGQLIKLKPEVVLDGTNVHGPAAARELHVHAF